MKRKCAVCKKVNPVKYKQDIPGNLRFYCSDECVRAAEHIVELPTGSCSVCGSPLAERYFISSLYFSNARFCSFDCAVKACRIEKYEEEEER